MTNHWIDIKNADAILIMGSNAAEHHPISFKWVLEAKSRGAVVMHVDPKFSRTSARSTFHVPLRSGTDIAFLGGMIHHILENGNYFKDYVVHYTNASFIVSDSYGFRNGLFSGYDPRTSSYDRSSWSFAVDAQGRVRRDPSLRHPRCVFQLLREHYTRYSLEKVADITGVSRENLLRVYEAYAATGVPDRAGTILYALGWTQHTVGVQNIRAAAIIQLLLGNIGMAGGGINALRGEPNVQGSTDHTLLYHLVPGYMSMPLADWQTLEDYNRANTPASSDPQSANWWRNKPKYLVSLLKGWFGEHATRESDFGYSMLPKLERGEDYSYLYLFDRMYQGLIRGGFIFGLNPANSVPNSNKVRKALDNLDWLVTMDVHHTETTDNWHRPGVDPAAVKTEVFLLPSAHRLEKEGSVTNSGRWLLWHYAAVKPPGRARSFGEMIVDLGNRVRKLYRSEPGAYPDPILKASWPEGYDADEVARRINGVFTSDKVVNGRRYRKGNLVPGFGALSDDGSTSCLNWLYCGSYTQEEGNKAKRRDPRQTPMQAAIGLYPNWAWCWPLNRRILYNRASVDPQGRPFHPSKAVIAWEEGSWVGDVPDGGWPPLSSGKGKHPFIMTVHGFGQLFGPGRVDGPFPEHYEPVETPVNRHPFSGRLHNPCYKAVTGDLDRLAAPADSRYPIVLTTYNMTEHWCGGGETRNVPNLLEAEPQLYVEMSPELAEEKGIRNGDPVIVESARGRVEAIAMVTVRMRPLRIQGRIVHEIGMPFCFGWTTPGCGDATNRLTPSVGDPNTSIPEFKACLVDVRKADRLEELAR
ncbi:formate dehydrogenase alpha subunit [Desulfacinum infernum DSM 9756]|nr:formate dehydrogenase alpha subunit [Desulfacinum infernum DSM 9756]